MLQVRNISWRTGNRLILDKVSVDVPTGKMLGLVGPNGSGKSTLLRVIAGLRRASAGHVLLDGTDVRQLSRQAFARRVAFVAQHAGTTADLTVRHVVSLGRTPHRGLFTAWRQQDESALLQALDFIGMKDRQSERWKDLSGGEQQRVHIARALAQSPCEILLDEPTNHLDIAHQLKLLTLIQSLRLTCVIALHDLNLAAMFCDSLLVLHEGKAAACGVPAEVLTEPLLQRVFNVKARLDISPYHGKPHLHFLP